MAYVNTGYTRRKKLTITKGTYTKSYFITHGFIYNGTTYPSLSDQGFARLSNAEYDARLRAFISRVYLQENGLQTDCPDMTIGSTSYNTSLCPLPPHPPQP